MISVRALPLIVPLAGMVAAASLLAPSPAVAGPLAPASSSVSPVSTAVSTASSTASSAPSSAPDTTRARTYKFFANNVAGRTQGNDGRVDPVAADLVRSIRRFEPYAGAINEMCANQARALDRRLQRYRVEFFGKDRACPGRGWFGNAVVIENGPVTRRRIDLPASEGSRELACVSRTSPRVAACSTHLTAERSRGYDRRAQARRVAQVTEGYVRRGFATYVGGDFNDQPQADTLDPMYKPAYGYGANGVFTESEGCCGRDGTPTLGTAKFDYGFFSRQWRRMSNRVVVAPHSDHDQVWVTLRRR